MTELLYDTIMNIFDTAFEIASQQTHEWVQQMAAKGIHVSEYQVGAKFTVFYEEAVMSAPIDVLNF